MVNPPPLAAFGKLGTCADFVRMRGAVAAAAFDSVDHWLLQANQHLYANRVALEHPIFWIGSLDQLGGELTCGVLSASRDSVGRSFPLAIFESLGIAIGPSFSLLPYRRQHFLQHANALAVQGETLDPAQLELCLRQIANADEPALPSIDDLEIQGAFPPIHEIMRHVFGEPLVDQIGYALAMLDAAAQRPFAAPAAVVLHGAVGSDLALFVWLELIAMRVASRKLEPTLLWSPSAQSLFISLGPPPAEALAWIAQSSLHHPAVWPLHSAQPEIAQRMALPYAGRITHLIQEPPSSIRGLIAALR